MFTEFTSGLTTLGFIFGNANPWELMILGMIALLLFGKRLPEVAKSLGKGIVEFKKGLAGVEDEIRGGGSSNSSSTRSTNIRRPEAIDEEPIVSAPKFEPPKSEPVASGSNSEQV